MSKYIEKLIFMFSHYFFIIASEFQVFIINSSKGFIKINVEIYFDVE